MISYITDTNKVSRNITGFESDEPCRLNFYATYRQIVGKKTVEISLDEGATLRQLIEGLVGDYPALRHEWFDEQGHLYGHVHLFVNGRDLPFLENALDTRLLAGYTVSVFSWAGVKSKRERPLYRIVINARH